MAGFKNEGLYFSKSAGVPTNPLSDDKVLLYVNGDGDVIARYFGGTEVNLSLTADTSADTSAFALLSEVADISAALNADIITNAGNITINAGDITNLQVDVTSISGDLVALDTRVDNVSAAFDDKIFNLDLDLQTQIVGLSGNISSVNVDTAALSAAIVSNSADIVSNSDDISSLQNDTSTNASDIFDNGQAISTLQSDLGDAQNDISNLQSDVSDNDTDISNLQDSVNNNTSAINDNAFDISDLQNATTGITGGLAQLDTAYVNVSGDTMTGNLTVAADVTVNGDLFVNGDQFIVDTEHVSASDNIIEINVGEVGPGVTSGYAGISVDRGSADNYFFLFDEVRDSFAIGTSTSELSGGLGLLQLVATREDAPQDGYLAQWNDAENRFDTIINAADLSLSTDTAALSAAIAINISDIAINAGNIATNTGDIATNTSDIAAISGSLGTTYVGIEDLDTFNDVYTITHPAVSISGSTPVVSLTVPGNGLMVDGITNRTTTSFDVVLSSVPEVSGYQINWTLDIAGNGYIVKSMNEGTLTTPSLTPDAVAFGAFSVVLDANSTLNLPTGMTNGQTISILVEQDGTGSRTLGLDASYEVAGGSYTVTAAANSVDVLTIKKFQNRYFLSAEQNFS